MASTPGPWTVERHQGTTRPDMVILADGDLLAKVFTHYRDGRPDGSVEANAQLMAEAPSLLAALKAMVGKYSTGTTTPTLDQARAAIERAEAKP